MWGIFHHAYAKDALLQTLVIFIAVSKWILIFFIVAPCITSNYLIINQLTHIHKISH